MALIVEDGSAKPDAQSYAAVAEGDTYWGARPTSTLGVVWNAVGTTTAKKEEALLLATQYIDMVYGLRMKGVKRTKEQALKFPRYGVTTDGDPAFGVNTVWMGDYGQVSVGYVWNENEIPPALKQATIEAAARFINGETLITDLDAGEAQTTSESIGPISVSYGAGGKLPYKKYRIIDMMMADLLICSASSVPIMRG